MNPTQSLKILSLFIKNINIFKIKKIKNHNEWKMTTDIEINIVMVIFFLSFFITDI